MGEIQKQPFQLSFNASLKVDSADVDISCDGSTAYFGDAGTNMQIEVYKIGVSGKLTEINNYTDTNGQDSDNILLSPDGTLLLVGETVSNQVETLSVGTGGALAFDSVASPKAGPAPSVLGMVSQKNGRYIFAAETGPTQVGVLKVQSTTLTEVANSPFSLNDSSAAVIGVTTFPPEVCP
jgi:6-phosphogluconolactonase (cycloisomerase 2 family)